MIKSLSPYYLSIPFVSPLTSQVCASYTLKIYVWDGLKTSSPVTPSYTMTKGNPTTSSASDKINIARLVNDFIDFTPTSASATSLINGNNQRWCKTSITYITSDAADTDIEQLITTTLIVRGYGYGMSGENPQLPSNKILLSGVEFKVTRTGVFNLPIQIAESAVQLAVLSGLSSGCLSWTYSIAYAPSAVTVQVSTNGGVTWSNQTGSSVSPRCGFSPSTTTMYRLKSVIDDFYSNVITVTI